MNGIRFLAAWGLLVTGGCSVLAPLPDPGAVQPPDARAARAPAEPAPGAPGARATTSLLAVGRSARAAGDYEGAAAYIEQALRIAPNDPELWIELGEIKLAEGDTGQAEMLGRKALTLTAGDSALASRARRLIGAGG